MSKHLGNELLKYLKDNCNSSEWKEINSFLKDEFPDKNGEDLRIVLNGFVNVGFMQKGAYGTLNKNTDLSISIKVKMLPKGCEEAERLLKSVNSVELSEVLSKLLDFLKEDKKDELNKIRTILLEIETGKKPKGVDMEKVVQNMANFTQLFSFFAGLKF